MYYVYIIENLSGKFYVGQTENMERRFGQHNDPKMVTKKFTRKNGPWTLVYAERCTTKAQAIQREKFIKSRKSAKWIREYLLQDKASPDIHRD